MGQNTLKIYQEHKTEFLVGGLSISWLFYAYQVYNDNRQIKALLSLSKTKQGWRYEKKQTGFKPRNQKDLALQYKMNKQNPIYRIALTGGPCAGKSTAMSAIERHFRKNGWKVFSVPQVPTIIGLGGGMSDWASYNTHQVLKFQTSIIDFKFYIENYFTKIAEMSKQPSIVLCDRGMVDCAAYMQKEMFQALRDQSGHTMVTLRDKRYDGVIFMNSAAMGAQEFYTLANNSARKESIQQARQLDKKTLNSWIGHPHITICPNIKGKPFSFKIDRAIKVVQKTIGLESSDIIYYKYLIQEPIFPKDIQICETEVQEIYLVNQNPRFVQDKIKKYGQDQSYTYQRRLCGPYIPEEPFREIFRLQLNGLQYCKLAEEYADPNYKPIIRKRQHFAFRSIYYNIDTFDEKISGQDHYKILRFELEQERVPDNNLPPFIKVIRQVRGQEQFRMGQIAKKSYAGQWNSQNRKGSSNGEIQVMGSDEVKQEQIIEDKKQQI